MKKLNIKAFKNTNIMTIHVLFIVALLVLLIFDIYSVLKPVLLIYIIIDIMFIFFIKKRKYFPTTHPIVAIDIDGTILDNKNYPMIGEPFEYSIETINRMNRHGYDIVIWSTRSSENIVECKKILLNYGLDHDVSFKIPDYDKDKLNISKVPAFVYIDNRNYGYCEDYENMWRYIHKDFLGMYPEEYDRILKNDGEVNIDK